jgi:IK cytokine
MIQESKFLGGDMEHTHLVKGLDYALLQKVRSEIVVKEQEQEEEMEKLAQVEEAVEVQEKQEKSDEVEFKTAMARNVNRIIQVQRSRHIERNELFAPSRMAFLIELEDENAESDIPTTIIRSKTEVPTEAGDTQTLTTNDIVINKLAQILSYLRQGGKSKKNKKRVSMGWPWG